MQFWLEKLKERHQLGDVGEDGRIILKLILKKLCARKTLGSMNDGEFID
jgi:hypothetical protein